MSDNEDADAVQQDEEDLPVLPETCRALVYRAYGTPAAVLMLEEEHPVPSFESSDVLIEVYSFSLNRMDVQLLKDHPVGYGTPSEGAPMVPSADGSGVVQRVGSSVTNVKVGDAVIFSNPSYLGAACEYVAVPHTAVAPKPDGMSFEDAASFPSGQAILEALDWMKLDPDGDDGEQNPLEEQGDDNEEKPAAKRVLVLGGAGGLGAYAVRYLKSRGYQVAATCSKRNVDFVKSLGADLVVDYESQKFWKMITPKSIDAIIETIGEEHHYRKAEKIMRSSKSCFASLHPFELDDWNKSSIAAFAPTYTKRKLFGPFCYYLVTMDATTENLTRVCVGADGKPLPSIRKESFKLEDFQRAYGLMAEGKATGKLVVNVKTGSAAQASTIRAGAVKSRAKALPNKRASGARTRTKRESGRVPTKKTASSSSSSSPPPEERKSPRSRTVVDKARPKLQRKARSSTAAAGGAGKPSAEDIAALPKYSLAELSDKDNLPDDVDARKLENYLREDDFQECFGMSADEYWALPSWKKLSKKKTSKLF